MNVEQSYATSTRQTDLRTALLPSRPSLARSRGTRTHTHVTDISYRKRRRPRQTPHQTALRSGSRGVKTGAHRAAVGATRGGCSRDGDAGAPAAKAMLLTRNMPGGGRVRPSRSSQTDPAVPEPGEVLTQRPHPTRRTPLRHSEPRTASRQRRVSSAPAPSPDPSSRLRVRPVRAHTTRVSRRRVP